MKKSILFLSILLAGYIANTFGQDPYVLTFTAENSGQHVPLDSILIVNLTQSGDTMLYAPDTVLILYTDSITTHLNELHKSQAFSVSPNYPHPFMGKTFVDVWNAEVDKINIRIFDLLGRTHASYKGVLDAGKHTFAFSSGSENFYVFSVSFQGQTKSIKIANPSSGQRNCKIEYVGFEKETRNLKSQRNDGFPFAVGDELRYIGYSATTIGVRGSDVIEDEPENIEFYTFDITEGIPCLDCPSVTYLFRTYNTVQIGSQCWLKESLNVGTMIPGENNPIDNGVIEKYCFSDNVEFCESHGGLYQWTEAMNYSTQEGAQGICPSGWHIPTDEEWKQLEGEVDSQYGYPDPEWDKLDYRGSDVGKRLKSQTGWNNNNGSNYFGFTALATGTRRFDGVFLNMGSYSGIWSSTLGNPNGAWYRYMEGYSAQVARTHNSNYMGRPIRCIKDSGK